MNKTIEENVINNIKILKEMNIKELNLWGKEQGYNTAQSFGRFKKMLEKNNIPYLKLRYEYNEKKYDELKNKVKYEVTLITDGSAKHNKFAITNKNGEPLWFGKFFSSDLDYNGEQSTSEMAAAKKGVWLAHKVAKAIGEDIIELNLKTDAQWLCWATDFRHNKGGKAKNLKRLADKYNVILNVEHIEGSANPADKYSRNIGFKKWSDNNLAELAEKK